MERAFIDSIFSDELNHEFEIACRLTDEAIAQFVNEIHAGITELELNEIILGTIDRVTADCAPEDQAGMDFLILESGARTALLHGRATDKVIEKGDFVTVDLPLYVILLHCFVLAHQKYHIMITIRGSCEAAL